VFLSLPLSVREIPKKLCSLNSVKAYALITVTQQESDFRGNSPKLEVLQLALRLCCRDHRQVISQRHSTLVCEALRVVSEYEAVVTSRCPQRQLEVTSETLKFCFHTNNAKTPEWIKLIFDMQLGLHNGQGPPKEGCFPLTLTKTQNFAIFHNFHCTPCNHLNLLTSASAGLCFQQDYHHYYRGTLLSSV